MPVIRPATAADDYRTSVGARSVGIKLRGTHGKFLHGVRRIILQETAYKIVIVVAAVHGKINVQAGTAAKRHGGNACLGGSEGSTGSVIGARYAMLAKLRLASGISSRSCRPMLVLITLLESQSAHSRAKLPRLQPALPG